MSLTIGNIPQLLLARILLQLLVIPHRLVKHERFDLLAIIAAGLQEYGSSSNLDAFFEFCTNKAKEIWQGPEPIEWPWISARLGKADDWDRVRRSADAVGLRLYLETEEARNAAELCCGRDRLHDARFIYNYKNSAVTIDAVLSGTLSYIEHAPLPKDDLLGQQALKRLVALRLERLTKERDEVTKSEVGSSADFGLMGALMLDYRVNSSGVVSPESWCLYLRDYIDSASGSSWRVLHAFSATDDEQRISSDQALADIRGNDINDTKPAMHSSHYRPICLFYCNNKIVQETIHGPPSDDQVVTLEDYTFDDEEEYDDAMDDILDAVCKHCGISDAVDDVNTIFICDGCNLGVHQLCEDPPITQEESDIDPWYCRSCAAQQNVVLDNNTEWGINKRKRDEAGDHTDGL